MSTWWTYFWKSQDICGNKTFSILRYQISSKFASPIGVDFFVDWANFEGAKFFCEVWLNQIFHYTRCNTPKRVTSWRGPSPRHCTRATQLLLKKCRSGGEPLATLCPIWPAQDLNLRSPAPETNTLPLDHLAGNNSILVWKFAPKFRWRPKRAFAAFSFNFSLEFRISWLFDFLIFEYKVGITCQKTVGAQTYFAPFSIRPKGVLPPQNQRESNRAPKSLFTALGTLVTKNLGTHSLVKKLEKTLQCWQPTA